MCVCFLGSKTDIPHCKLLMANQAFLLKILAHLAEFVWLDGVLSLILSNELPLLWGSSFFRVTLTQNFESHWISFKGVGDYHLAYNRSSWFIVIPNSSIYMYHCFFFRYSCFYRLSCSTICNNCHCCSWCSDIYGVASGCCYYLQAKSPYYLFSGSISSDATQHHS